MTAPTPETNAPEKLSIVVPVYNEEGSVAEIVDRLFAVDFAAAGLEMEVIAVDDGSTDGSLRALRELLDRHANLRVFSSSQNIGKGAALRIGFAVADGTLVTVQDADLEYEPEEFIDLVQPILAGETDVVYGSRYLSGTNVVSTLNRLGNGFLSLVTSVLFGQWLTDMETCYKVFRKDVVDAITLSSTGFEIEPELTVKFLRELRRRGKRIHERPITYQPRTKQGGKKIDYVADGFKALGWLLSLRVSRGDAPGPWAREGLVAQARPVGTADAAEDDEESGPAPQSAQVADPLAPVIAAPAT